LTFLRLLFFYFFSEEHRMSRLFSTFIIRGIEFKNRIFVSPMCMYSSRDGMPTDWHMVHLGSRAVGGAGLVMVEATGVSPEGRISPDDSGIWSDEHARAFAPIAKFIDEHGAVPAIQIAHAGRKASTDAPWRGGGPLGPKERGWQPLAPSAIPFSDGFPLPREMTRGDIEAVLGQFVDAAERSLAAGFQVVEVHSAHGYLLHEFLSPLSNHRSDEYGGSLENRMRFPLRVAKAVREVWPKHLPLFVRISATDWVEGGWDLAQSVEYSRRLKDLGVDLIDCSAGYLMPRVHIPEGPGYLTPFAYAIRRDAGIATGSVGFITEPFQAEQIIATNHSDVVFLARQMLRDPYWPLHAAKALNVELRWPDQYARAK
jgi:2,4-dienoyl-CoA reductase-like NADH-dependent reductase (Old Yellow Enzyme family)